MSLDPARCQLLIVDMQARLMPSMDEIGPVTARCRALIEGARAFGVPILASEQYPEGLGETDPGLVQALGNAPRLPKTDFSAAADAEIRAEIEARHGEGQDRIVVAGIEAHVCVMQTVLDLLGAGLAVAVVSDAVTAHGAENRRAAVKRMTDAGATLATTEMVLFEWAGSSRSPAFKTVSRLVKGLREA
ncbi:MAG: isochorismatase family protein [Pseudomonadota bacterium]